MQGGVKIVNNETPSSLIPYGLFELDGAGTIIHYDPAVRDQKSDGHPPVQDVLGRNFFNDILSFTESREFKSRFLAFMTFGDATQRFTATFPSEQGTIKIQILLTRIIEHSHIGRRQLALVRLMPDTCPAAI